MKEELLQPPAKVPSRHASIPPEDSPRKPMPPRAGSAQPRSIRGQKSIQAPLPTIISEFRTPVSSPRPHSTMDPSSSPCVDDDDQVDQLIDETLGPEDDTESDRTPSKHKVGRPSAHDRVLIDEAAAAMFALATKASRATNRPIDIVIHAFNHLVGGKSTYSLSWWNYYTAWFHANIEEERARLVEAHGPAYANIKHRKSSSLLAQWPYADACIAATKETHRLFCEWQGEEWLAFLVNDYEIRESVEVTTVAARERAFQKWHSDLVALVRCSQPPSVHYAQPLTAGAQIAQGNRSFEFQALLAVCGNNVNDDQALGHLHETGCLEGFVEERLKMNANHFIGQLKTFS